MKARRSDPFWLLFALCLVLALVVGVPLAHRDFQAVMAWWTR